MKFGVREICDVVFKTTAATTIGNTTFAKGQPVLYIDTAKTSALEAAATTVYATGGKGNPRLLAWEGEKTLTFTVEDAMLSPIGFAMLSGAGVIEATVGAPIQVHTTLELIAGVAGAVSIDGNALGLTGAETATVYTGADAEIYGTVVDEAGATIEHLGAATAAGSIVTANGATTPTKVDLTFTVPPTQGERVVVDFYLTKTGNVTQMEIEAGKFAGYYYVEASTLFRDQATGEDFPAEFIIPKAKIQSNFTFNMASTGDPSTFSFVMDAFPAPTAFSTKKVLAAIQVITDELG